MNTPLKLAGFGLGLVATFGAAVGVGSAVGPVGPAVQSSVDDHGTDTGAEAGGHDDAAAHGAGAAELPAGTGTPVAFRILGPERGPVTEYTDLQPYLGVYGHPVVLRDGDLANLHAHPVEQPGDAAGPEVGFATTAPSAGSYRLSLDFKHGSVVRTAAFTVAATAEHEEGGS
jgi:hypothetical protein